MTNSQRLTIRSSEIRSKLNELSGLETLDDENRSELDALSTQYRDVEAQLRAALISEGEAEQRALASAPDAEMRERLELRSRASLINYLQARMSGLAPSGAEAELNQAAGIGAGIPLELWDVETRADAPTGAPGTVGINLDRIRPAVFANSIAPKLGIEMPRVESGSYASATITTSLTASAKAKSAETDSTAATFTVTSVQPKRISARLSVTLEDVAAIGQANFESILRENLSLVLSDELDKQMINGTGASNGLIGIFQRLTDPSDPTVVADFDAFASAHAGGVDGLWANMINEVGIVVGPATYGLASRTFQTSSSFKGELSAAAYAMANTGGFWTNKRMPAADNSNFQQAILYRKGRSMMGASGGGMRTAVCPHWNEISIDDIYSGSGKGERYFTLHVLLGDVILVQPLAYSQISYQLA